MQHGAESFFIEGEGLVDASLGGRTGEETDRVDEPTAAASAQVAGDPPPFRFSRIGPKGRQLSDQNRLKIATAMIREGKGRSGIPAGFTYLGQFVDHDLTADRTLVELGEHVSPGELLQGRSPKLDLDSLYGAGPGDEESERFYAEDGVHLKVGRTVEAKPGAGFDLPRLGTGTDREARTANIPDLRNDENLAVAQTHAAFIRFHNRVVDELAAEVPAHQRFRRARRRVVKHYQWMLRTDYLPRILEPAVVDDVFTNGRKVVAPHADPLQVPTMPVEFSVAAFRLGHSMIRSAYNWNKIFDDGAGTLEFLFEFSATSGPLGGNERLISVWVIDWRRMYDFGEAGRADLTVPADKANTAMRIDTRLVDPLGHLPKGAFGGRGVPATDAQRNLAFRNLTRAQMLQLATGQQMVEKLVERGVAVASLTSQQIIEGDGGAVLDQLTDIEKQNLAEHTPLWFYILREAELNGGRLTGVGARLVAETFHRAIEGSRFSILRDPDWRPTLGPDNTTFRMADLLLFAFDGKEKLLNPNG
jgi:Animal haem peroxidase